MKNALIVCRDDLSCNSKFIGQKIEDQFGSIWNV